NISLGIMPGGAMNCCVLCVVLRPEYCTSASVTSLQICILISACALGGSFFTACAMLSKNNSILLLSDAKCFRRGRMFGPQSFRTYLSFPLQLGQLMSLLELPGIQYSPHYFGLLTALVNLRHLHHSSLSVVCIPWLILQTVADNPLHTCLSKSPKLPNNHGYFLRIFYEAQRILEDPFFSSYTFFCLTLAFQDTASKLIRDVFPDFLFEVLQLHWHTLHLGTIEHWMLFDRFYDVQ
ncbi:hypothetical protein ALC53_12429, partial [Atta colombica]